MNSITSSIQKEVHWAMPGSDKGKKWQSNKAVSFFRLLAFNLCFQENLASQLFATVPGICKILQIG
jgi:hypothetical protein